MESASVSASWLNDTQLTRRRIVGVVVALFATVGPMVLLTGTIVGHPVPTSLGFVMIALVGVAVVAERAVPRSVRRTGEYWWLGVAVALGLGSWATFAYLGARLRNATLAACGALYFVAIATCAAIGVVAHHDDRLFDVAVALWLGIWAASIIHAVAIRGDVRRALDGDTAPLDARSAAQQELEQLRWRGFAMAIAGVLVGGMIGGWLWGAKGHAIGAVLGFVPAAAMLIRRLLAVRGPQIEDVARRARGDGLPEVAELAEHPPWLGWAIMSLPCAIAGQLIAGPALGVVGLWGGYALGRQISRTHHARVRAAVLARASALDRQRLTELVQALERLYGTKSMKRLRYAALGDGTGG